MKKSVFPIVFLFFVCVLSAQNIWHKPDSLLSFPINDSISVTDEYTVYTVFRNMNPDTTQLLWGITEKDTLRTAVLSNGFFSDHVGIFRSESPRDFSRWCIYYHRTGCRMDTAKRYALHLGSAMAYWQDSMPQSQELTSDIAMEEFAYFSGPLLRKESGSFLTYLALKYGITLDLAPYVTPVGDTLWSISQDRAYYHRVTGIGVDSLHQWSAIRSESKEDADLQIVCNNLRAGEYMLVGDNDGGLYGILQPDGLYRMERQWRLRTNASRPLAVSINRNTRQVGNSGDSLWLIVTDVNEREVGRYLPSNIIGDSVYVYALTVSDTLLTLQLESPQAFTDHPDTRRSPMRNSSSGNPSNLTVRYSKDGFITIEGGQERMAYDYYLYDSASRLIMTLKEVEGSSFFVGVLPPGVYHIEVVHEGTIVGDVRIIVT